MGWNSTTIAARVSEEAQESAWQRICELKSQPLHAPLQVICCYYIQGKCKFGDRGCQFSHDLNLIGKRHCTFGQSCRLGHAPSDYSSGGLGGVGESPSDGGVGLAASATASQGDDVGIGLDIIKEAWRVGRSGIQAINGASSGDEATYVACNGPNFDDSDPLWDEIACILQEDTEEVGDGDMSHAARNRLGHLGQYWRACEKTAHEWLCIPAADLLERLKSEAVQAKITNSRRSWLTDDLGDGGAVWSTVVIGGLIPRRLLPPAAGESRESTVVDERGSGRVEPTPPAPDLAVAGAAPAANADAKGADGLESRWVGPWPPLPDPVLVQAAQAAEASIRAVMATRDVALDGKCPPLRLPDLATGSLVDSVWNKLFEELRVALGALCELQRVTSAVARRRFAQTKVAGSEPGRAVGAHPVLAPLLFAKLNPLDENLGVPGVVLPPVGIFEMHNTNTFRVAEVRKSVERCLFIARVLLKDDAIVQSNAVPTSPGGGAGGDSQVSLVPGSPAVLSGLELDHERSLNGEEVRLDHYDAPLDLWHVDLHLSKRRILCSPRNLQPVSSTSGVASGVDGAKQERSRSRSPRRMASATGVGLCKPVVEAGASAPADRGSAPRVMEQAGSFREVVRAAASRGEYILARHIVRWTGCDANLSGGGDES